MKLGNKIWILVIGLVVAIIFYFLTTNNEKYFNIVELPSKDEVGSIINQTDYPYIDTIIALGLRELNIKPRIVVVRNMNINNLPPENEGLLTMAYIIGMKGGYLIFVRKLEREDYISVLSHELIHLEQYQRRDLEINLIEKYITWKGKRYYRGELPPYTLREWEIEADKRGGKLEIKLKSIFYK